MTPREQLDGMKRRFEAFNRWEEEQPPADLGSEKAVVGSGERLRRSEAQALIEPEQAALAVAICCAAEHSIRSGGPETI
jgi:hypothetical protein